MSERESDGNKSLHREARNEPADLPCRCDDGKFLEEHGSSAAKVDKVADPIAGDTLELVFIDGDIGKQSSPPVERKTIFDKRQKTDR
ncbi:hypothetical protein RvY_15997 [Ramazzottius varieornatus]|uniref:Uncharacterized protein n=1 Tax=Ramazzottius varieornatus TaxID=947166 RepID=A0A1D1VYB2_RAMVA|nr:hypothetical protein RvY_15997 [Ramazzottius varieornatus]